MADRIRWAVIGTGAIAARFVADMHHSRHGRVVAVGSRSADRAAAFAAHLPSDVATGTFESLLGRDDIDAIYLATPNEVHAEHALAAIAAAKPVLIEKPIATNAGEARTIADAGRRAGVLVMEAMWMRFTPGIVRLKRAIDEGLIGAIRRIDISTSFPQAFDPTSPLYDPVNGGALLDLGVYPLSLAVHLAGVPHSINATTIRASNGAVSAAGMVLGYDEAIATLSCGFDAEGANEATIAGTSGILRAHRSVLCPSVVSFRRTSAAVAGAIGASPPTPPSGSKPLAALTALRPLLAGLKTRRWPTLHLGSGLQYQADHFAECLRRGLTESPVMPLDQSIAVLDLVEQAMAADKSTTAR